ncbi:SusC/RagA family TonB-linked outer membrane protein [Tenacibaculum larymnensis]|uniref:SusC/RagA family TonB-linked outer membrane protein n=1 Tax=Tenacibaculum larymnensis TaxID=2878201 RepID=A0A9X4INP8_9FLAO|nr:SusC/RagA family TonB-linked outer membrane protein [Tenacibaculum larymnensis]MDE1205227.1 SusC/RagA family TonB-linked outer membrane protein [Tenacibaculum larymnensis]
MKKMSFSKTLLINALIFLFSSFIYGQTIKGKIVGVNGESIPFANIIEKGTTNGTTSNESGEFSLNVKKLPTVVIISSLGFVTIEKNVVNTDTFIQVTLREDSDVLEEVVISGLASTVKRKNLANSVATISAEKLAGVAPPQTLDGALAGKFTGAVITSNSGAPGGGLSVKLRGITSINGNSQPLYIIDGVYVDNSSISSGGLNTVSQASTGGNASSQDNATNRIADINPNDIESIEILKGASASAIYGSRGAAGVVIITTKSGKTGKARVNFSQSVGFNEIINLQGQRKWTEELVESQFPGEGVLYTAAKNAGKLRDYEKELFGEKGIITKTNLSLSGGSEKTTYFAGFSRSQENGIVKNTGYDKTSVRLNLGHQLNEKMKISLSSNYINSSADRGFFNNDNSGATIGVALTATRPWDYLLPDANGNYPDHPNNSSNPLQTRDLMTNNERIKRFIVGGSYEYDIYRNDNSSLKFVAKAGTDHYTLTATVIFPKELQFMRPDNGGINGLTAISNTVNTNSNYSAFLVHNFNTKNDLRFTTQAGLTNEQFSQNVVRVTATDLIASETNVDQSANQNVNQFRLEQEDFGFYVQEAINYQNKIIATLGIRGDKSTNNGDPNELFYYPKASLASNLHNFKFWGEKKGFNRLKLRGAYGEAGTFAAFGSLYTIYGNTSIDGNVGIVVPITRGNAKIKPERQKELEVGFDAGFLNDRLSLEFTYYKKDVEDLLLTANTEPSTGYTTEWVNAGELQNKGFEIGLNAKVFDSEDFTWDSGVSWYRNRSKMTMLNVPTFNLGGFGNSLGQFQIEEGKSVTQIVGTTGPGTPVVKLGDAEPDFQMSFNNTLKYKNISLSFLWHWKKGGDNINLSKLLSDFGGTSNDYDEITLDPDGVIPNGTYRINNGLFAGNARPFVEDASYLRLREVGLYYSFDKEVLDNVFSGAVSSLKIGFSGNNLVNIFDYNSYDPEVSNFGGNGLSTGVEVTPFPSSKRYMFHLSAQF